MIVVSLLSHLVLQASLQLPITILTCFFIKLFSYKVGVGLIYIIKIRKSLLTSKVLVGIKVLDIRKIIK